MRAELAAYVQQITGAFGQISSGLENIQSDQKGLLALVEDLKNQITGLTPDEKTALDNVVAAARALVAKTQETADSVPDVPAPPPSV